MKSFKDKVVVITGAGGGMGLAYAEAFAREGARLALNDWDAQSLGRAKERVLALGAPAVHVSSFDVSDRDAMYAFADEVRATLGPAHIIINNAGIEGEARPVWDMSDESYDKVLGVNLWGVIHGTRAFLPQLFDNGEGAVVNVSSIFGLVGPPVCSDYAASKFAVRGFTEALTAELHGSNITAHTVHPGGIATNIARKAESQAFKDKFLKTEPDDIARFVLKGIRAGHPRIVYGHRSLVANLGSRFVPLRVLNGVVRWFMGSVFDDIQPPAPRAT